MEVLGKWGYGVASEKTQPYQFDSGRLNNVHSCVKDDSRIRLKKLAMLCYAGTSQQKRRRIAATKVWDVESEQEEHSLSLSQHSSPSQSDQEQTPGQKPNASSVIDSQRYHRVKLVNKIPSTCQLDNFVSNKRFLKKWTPLSQQDLQPKQEQYLHVDGDKKGTRHQALEPKPANQGYTQQLVNPLLSNFKNSTQMRFSLFFILFIVRYLFFNS
jgi:hypothetical protein